MPGLQEIEQPTSIRFYNEEREFIGEIDNFTSAVYVRRWETFGNFEIHFTEDRPDLFVPGYYIMINNDRYRNGIIQYYKNDSDGYEPKSLKDIVIKGFSLLYLLPITVIGSGITSRLKISCAIWLMNRWCIQPILHEPPKKCVCSKVSTEALK